jgi:hypothetical protein
VFSASYFDASDLANADGALGAAHHRPVNSPVRRRVGEGGHNGSILIEPSQIGRGGIFMVSAGFSRRPPRYRVQPSIAALRSEALLDALVGRSAARTGDRSPETTRLPINRLSQNEDAEIAWAAMLRASQGPMRHPTSPREQFATQCHQSSRWCVPLGRREAIFSWGFRRPTTSRLE